MRYPLVDGQGNFGSIDGDMPGGDALHRGAARPSSPRRCCATTSTRRRCDWIPNYDGSEREPNPLPAKVPNLLVNGSSGIAVGMATNIPPHNLTEVIAALELYMDDPGGAAREADGGAARARLPDRRHHPRPRRASARPTPPAAAPSRCAPAPRSRTQQGRPPGHHHHRDPVPGEQGAADRAHRRAGAREDDRGHHRPARRVGPRRHPGRGRAASAARSPEVILNSLYKLTPMQISFGINMLAIVDNQPQTLGAQGAAAPLPRPPQDGGRPPHPLRPAQGRGARPHPRRHPQGARPPRRGDHHASAPAATPAEARKDRLQAEFALSEVQAQAILEMRLQRLTGLERDKVVEEYREVMATDRAAARDPRSPTRWCWPRSAASSASCARRYGDERRTEIIDATRRHHDRGHDRRRGHGDHGHPHRLHQALAAVGLPRAAARRQGPHGDGDQGRTTSSSTSSSPRRTATSWSSPSAARCTGSRCTRSPSSSRRRAARRSSTCSSSGPRRRWRPRSRSARSDAGRYLFFVTEQGTVKKTELSAFANPLARGIIAHRHRARATACSTSASPTASADVLLATAQGPRHPLPREPTCGRWAAPPTACAASGCESGDQVVGMAALDGSGDILTVASRGYGKRTVDRRSTASRAAAARASSTSRCRPRPARWWACSRSTAGDQRHPDQPGREAHPHRGRRHAHDRPLDPGRQGDGPRGRGHAWWRWPRWSSARKERRGRASARCGAGVAARRRGRRRVRARPRRAGDDAGDDPEDARRRRGEPATTRTRRRARASTNGQLRGTCRFSWTPRRSARSRRASNGAWSTA